MARDMQVEFQARFQAKQARREAVKAAKQDPILKKQIQDLLKKGETQKAYQKAKMLLSKQALAQQMDQMADMAELSSAQIQANNAMNRMTHMMASSSKVMNAAQKNTNPEKVGYTHVNDLWENTNSRRRPSLPSSNSSSKTKNTPCLTASTKTPLRNLRQPRSARMPFTNCSASWLMMLVSNSARNSTRLLLRRQSLSPLPMNQLLRKRTSSSRDCVHFAHS